MKNLKKLFVAAIMLVVALTAVVSSTYAWFTLQNEVDVNDMELNVGTAGLDLQISSTGTAGDYGYSLNLGTPTGTLTPVTYDFSDNTFQLLVLDETKEFFKYEEAASFGMSGTDGQFLSYDLWFVTSSEGGVTLYLDTTEIPFKEVDNNADYAMRIMFVPVVSSDPVWGEAIIYAPTDGSGGYGTGDYFEEANHYIAYDAFTKGTVDVIDDFLKPLAGGVYALNTGEGNFMEGRQYSTTAPESDQLDLGTLTQNVAKQYRVFIWIEGWDGDATDTMASSNLTTYLLFKGR